MKIFWGRLWLSSSYLHPCSSVAMSLDGPAWNGMITALLAFAGLIDLNFFVFLACLAARSR